MTDAVLLVGDRVVIEAGHLQNLLQALINTGFQLVGPIIRNGDLVYGELKTAADLPVGWTDDQESGTFRLKPRGDEAFFGFGVGQHSWRQYLLPSRCRLWHARRDGNSFVITSNRQEAFRYAFIGVHACDLQAIAIQDRIFLKGKYIEPSYRERRETLFIVAVNCTQAGGTCFCTSMGTGPKAVSGFDLALTEILTTAKHCFLVEVGSGRGAGVLRNVPHTSATAEVQEQAERLLQKTAAQMGRQMDTVEIRELLYRNYENPRWEEVGGRCLSCGNCTMVCPTCFCQAIEDITDLTGQEAERWQRWDVCYTLDHSYIHGGSIRSSAMARYRQWLTHKLATWIDQFGCSGCVGCGRCITWCPAAIDITEEINAIRKSDSA